MYHIVYKLQSVRLVTIVRRKRAVSFITVDVFTKREVGIQ
jgi:hypothetical protein